MWIPFSFLIQETAIPHTNDKKLNAYCLISVDLAFCQDGCPTYKVLQMIGFQLIEKIKNSPGAYMGPFFLSDRDSLF